MDGSCRARPTFPDVPPRYERHFRIAQGGRRVPVDKAVALACARLHVPDPRPERDAFIAASALIHEMTLVTRNVVDFVPMGVALLNPWDERT